MKVLVIGDVIVDRYISGSASRLSPEAPVPVVEQNSISESQGGAGLVYENLKNLGVDVDLYDPEQPRSVKTRVFCDGHYLTRIDNDAHANSGEVVDSVLNQSFSEYEYVILSDYGKGVLDNCVPIIDHLNSFGCRVIVDPKKPCENYSGAWLVKPNNKEYVKFDFENWQSNIIITQAGENVVARIDNQEYVIPIDPVEVNDVTGAGDCFLAAFVYGLSKGYNYQTCLKTAVKGSRESVQHLGTYVLEVNDVEDRVVFTNGVFDVLHKGHFELLSQAREQGDKLIIGINSDESVRRLKGSNRPVNNQEVRKSQLEMLPWVDEVRVFEQDTPYEMIKEISPNLIVKGSDYAKNEVVGHDLADVYLVPIINGYSSTNIINSVKNDQTSGKTA